MVKRSEHFHCVITRALSLCYYPHSSTSRTTTALSCMCPRRCALHERAVFRHVASRINNNIGPWYAVVFAHGALTAIQKTTVLGTVARTRARTRTTVRTNDDVVRFGIIKKFRVETSLHTPVFRHHSNRSQSKSESNRRPIQLHMHLPLRFYYHHEQRQVRRARRQFPPHWPQRTIRNIPW